MSSYGVTNIKNSYNRKISSLSSTNIYREVNDPFEPDPPPEEVEEYARRIGIDPASESYLIKIAFEGLKEKLPPNWKPCLDPNKNEWYYLNTLTKETQWEHPLEKDHKIKVIEARQQQSMNRIQNFDSSTLKNPRNNLPKLGPLKDKKGGSNLLNPLQPLPKKSTSLQPLDKKSVKIPSSPEISPQNSVHKINFEFGGGEEKSSGDESDGGNFGKKPIMAKSGKKEQSLLWKHSDIISPEDAKFLESMNIFGSPRNSKELGNSSNDNLLKKSKNSSLQRNVRFNLSSDADENFYSDENKNESENNTSSSGSEEENLEFNDKLGELLGRPPQLLPSKNYSANNSKNETRNEVGGDEGAAGELIKSKASQKAQSLQIGEKEREEMELRLRRLKEELLLEEKKRENELREELERALQNLKSETDKTLEDAKKSLNSQLQNELLKIKAENEERLKKEMEELLVQNQMRLNKKKQELINLNEATLKKIEAEIGKIDKSELLRVKNLEILAEIEEESQKNFENLKSRILQEQSKQIEEIKSEHEKLLGELTTKLKNEEEKILEEHKKRKEEFENLFKKSEEERVENIAKTTQSPQKSIQNEENFEKSFEKPNEEQIKSINLEESPTSSNMSQTDTVFHELETEHIRLKSKFRLLHSKYTHLKHEISSIATYEKKRLENDNIEKIHKNEMKNSPILEPDSQESQNEAESQLNLEDENFNELKTALEAIDVLKNSIIRLNSTQNRSRDENYRSNTKNLEKKSKSTQHKKTSKDRSRQNVFSTKLEKGQKGRKNKIEESEEDEIFENYEFREDPIVRDAKKFIAAQRTRLSLNGIELDRGKVDNLLNLENFSKFESSPHYENGPKFDNFSKFSEKGSESSGFWSIEKPQFTQAQNFEKNPKVGQDIDGLLNSLRKLDVKMKNLWSSVKPNNDFKFYEDQHDENYPERIWRPDLKNVQKYGAEGELRDWLNQKL